MSSRTRANQRPDPDGTLKLQDGWSLVRTRGGGGVALLPGTDPQHWIRVPDRDMAAAQALAYGDTSVREIEPMSAWGPAVACAENKSQADLDTRLLGRLQELDAAYGDGDGARAAPRGPVALDAEELLATLERAHAARRCWDLAASPWPTLPISTLRRAQAAAQQGGGDGEVLLWHDVDATSRLLARAGRVTVVQPDPACRGWLARQAQSDRARCQLIGQPPRMWPRRGFDVMVAAAVGGAADAEMWLAAAAGLRPRGVLLLSVREPLAQGVRAQAELLRFCLEGTQPDHDIPVLPGAWAIDAAADLLLFRAPAARGGADAVPHARALRALQQVAEATPSALVRVEVVCLDPAKLTQPDSPRRFLEALDVLGPTTTQQQLAEVTGDTTRLWWVGRSGASLCGQWEAAHGYFFATLEPYDAALERAVMASALCVLGDRLTRVRPPRRQWAELQEYRFG